MMGKRPHRFYFDLVDLLQPISLFPEDIQCDWTIHFFIAFYRVIFCENIEQVIFYEQGLDNCGRLTYTPQVFQGKGNFIDVETTKVVNGFCKIPRSEINVPKLPERTCQ